eukprot:GHVS01055374.1.p1 GENE.GHVS01055374.1~~GHVS01055374.1.p1  ORF type:complete len:1005 (+),score=119.86 GHVS01055374.1:139-3153(+)
MAPPSMKGLTLFVADIRSCPTKEAESKRVTKELAKIRQKISSAPTGSRGRGGGIGSGLSGYDRKKYMWKLVYSYTLGYSVDIAHMEIIHLLSSTKYSEKNAGYIACSILLTGGDNQQGKQEVLRLIVNLLKSELIHPNELYAALALNCIANVGTQDMSENLMTDIGRMVNPAAGVKAYIRRKAYMCMLKLYRHDRDGLPPEPWNKRLAMALQNERDIGCLTSLVSLLIGILENSDSSQWANLQSDAIACLSRIMSGDVPPSYIYYAVPAPWLQVKLLRLLQFFPPSNDIKMLTKENELIHTLLSKTPAGAQAEPAGTGSKKKKRTDQDRINKCNIEHGVLFEAMNLGIHLENGLDLNTKKLAATALGSFASAKEANIRYLGLETMARMASDPVIVNTLKKHATAILAQLTEPDISIRRQALNLLYSICDKDNWGYIVDQLLENLKGADVLLQEELVLKIAILVEKNAPDFTWYVDVVFKMIEYAPDCVSDDIWFRVVQVVTGFDDGTDKTELQTYAAQKAYDYLSDKYSDETMVKLGAYLLGEFGHHISDEAPAKKQLAMLHKHFARVSMQARALLLIAYAKLANAHPSLHSTVLGILRDCDDSQDAELQTRACELALLLQSDEETVEKTLAMMPTFSERVQANNPLIRRMKLAGKSRAHSRKALDEAAKTTGGLYKPSMNLERHVDEEKEEEEEEVKVEHRREESSESSSSRSTTSEESSSSGSESSGESEKSTGDEDDLKLTKASDVKGLWKNLCVSKQGHLYVSTSLCVSVVTSEYRGSEGRITLRFVNRSETAIVVIQSVTIQDLPTIRVRTASGQPPSAVSLSPGAVCTHQLQTIALQPFLNPPRYLVVASVNSQNGNEALRLPFSLPVVLTKFVVPAALSAEVFQKYWAQLENQPTTAPREMINKTVIGSDQFEVYLKKAFNLHTFRIGRSLCGAGTFHTATPNQNQPGKLLCVACMCKIEQQDKASGRAVRISVRAAHAQVGTALLQLIAAYFFPPA